MKALVATLLLALASAAHADCRMQRNDSMDWKGDKRAHLLWSGLTGAVVDVGDAYLDLGLTYWQKVGIAVVPGLLRELKTACGSDPAAGFSHQDNAYNVLGAMISVGIGKGVRVWLSPNNVTLQVEIE
jgi:hypothetical protein